MGRELYTCRPERINIQSEVEKLICTQLKVLQNPWSDSEFACEVVDRPQGCSQVLHNEDSVSVNSSTGLSTGLVVRISPQEDDWNNPVKRAKRPGVPPPRPLLVPIHNLPSQSGTMPKTNNGLMEAARKHLVLLRTDATHIETYVRLAHEYGHSAESIAETAWLTVDLVNDILDGA